MDFLKKNFATITLISICAIWVGVSLGTDRCPSCVIGDISKNALSLGNDAPRAETAKAEIPPAPAWTAIDTNGSEISSRELQGKVSVVVYWASWCGGCKREIPDLVALRERFTDSELEVIGLSVDEPHKDLEAFANRYGINYRIARVTPSVNDAFGRVENIPTLFILDKQGHIQFRHTGHISVETLSERVRNLLASS